MPTLSYYWVREKGMYSYLYNGIYEAEVGTGKANPTFHVDSSKNRLTSSMGEAMYF